MLQNSTMTTRLLGGFAVVIAMLAAVAVLGLLNLRSLNERVDRLANNSVPQVILAGQWEAAVLRSARHMQAVFVLTEQDEIGKELKALRDNLAAGNALHAQVKALATSGGAQSMLGQLERSRKAYLDAELEFIGHAEAGRLDEAKAVLLVKVRAAQLAYIDGIHKLGTVASEEARGMARDSASAYHASVTAVVIATLLCVAAATLLALLLSRGLRRQLGGEPAYAAAVVSSVASGDLTVDVRLTQGDRESLLFAVGEMVNNLRDMVAEATQGAQSVADTSAQIAQGNLDLSQRTEEQASTLQDTASSMEELTSTVARNAQNAKQASQLAATASETARKGGQAVDEVVTTMDEILDASKKIGDIISVIDGIAFQTNILALNAAVEAARAGEQGRGFAVVAAEVRNLAHRTTVAAKEIKTLIRESAGKVEAGSSRVDAAGHTMVGIVLSVQKVTELIAEIAAASQEQSAKIGQVSHSVVQMEHVVQQNASLVEEATAATESMKEQAASLLRMVSRFRIGDTGAGAGDAPVLAAAGMQGALPVRARTSLPFLRSAGAK